MAKSTVTWRLEPELCRRLRAAAAEHQEAIQVCAARLLREALGPEADAWTGLVGGGADPDPGVSGDHHRHVAEAYAQDAGLQP